MCLKITTGKFLVVFYLLTLSATALKGQNATSSPYSRFGIGDLSSSSFAPNIAMGSTEYGLNQAGHINYGNPAAYSALWYTTYEGGVDFKQYEFKSGSKKHRTHTASVSYFDFAFPIVVQKWSLGFGLLPYSKVGYSEREEKINQLGDTEINKYEGSGGLNNFHIGTGLKITKNLSFGVNTEYLFGIVNNDRTVEYDNPYYFNTSITSSTSIGWFHFNSGLQLHFDSLPIAPSDSIIFLEKRIKLLEDSLDRLIKDRSVEPASETYTLKNQLAQEIAAAGQLKKSVVNRKAKSDWRFVLGLVASPTTDLRARNSNVINSFRYRLYGVTDPENLPRDTVVNTEGERSFVRLPMSAGIGFSLSKGSRWLFAGDFSYQQWSDFTFLEAEDSLVDSWRVSAGIQFIPNDRALKSYWKSVQYRIGAHYDNGYLKLKGENIRELGITAGFGLPIRKAGTILHFSFDAGKRGTEINNLVLEKYFKFTFGFTINDRWFIKPKYD